MEKCTNGDLKEETEQVVLNKKNVVGNLETDLTLTESEPEGTFPCKYHESIYLNELRITS